MCSVTKAKYLLKQGVVPLPPAVEQKPSPSQAVGVLFLESSWWLTTCLCSRAESEAEPASSRSELSHSQSAPATGSENGAYSSVMFCAKNNVSLVRGAAETRAPAAGDDVLQ